MSFLESQVEKITKACITVNGIEERVEIAEKRAEKAQDEVRNLEQIVALV